MDFAKFAERVEEIYQESVSSGYEECEEPEPTVEACEDIHDTILRVFKRCPQDFKFTLGTIFSTALIDETVFDIRTREELDTRIEEVIAARNQQISVSSTDAMKILGYGVNTEVHGGVKYAVYRPHEREDDWGGSAVAHDALFYVPEKYEDEKVVDTFPFLLLTSCLKLADDFAVEETLTPCDDMDAYHSAADKGGKYRELSVVKANALGELVCRQTLYPVAYMLDGVRKVTCVTEAGTKSYPFTGRYADCFRSANLIVDPEGTRKLGNGLFATGQYDPTSFFGGVPDTTLETLLTVIGLMKVDENKFIKRYNSFVKGSMSKKNPPSAKQSTRARPVRPNLAAGGSHARHGGGRTRSPLAEGGGSRHIQQNWPTLEQKAIAALVWLKRVPSAQLNSTIARFPDIHGYTTQFAAYLGNGTRRSNLLNHVKAVFSPTKILDAVEDASDMGMIPRLALNDEAGEFEASDVLIYTLFLLKHHALIRIVDIDGVGTTFHCA